MAAKALLSFVFAAYCLSLSLTNVQQGYARRLLEAQFTGYEAKVARSGVVSMPQHSVTDAERIPVERTLPAALLAQKTFKPQRLMPTGCPHHKPSGGESGPEHLPEYASSTGTRGVSVQHTLPASGAP